MARSLVLLAMLLTAPAYALDCGGDRLVIEGRTTKCAPLSQADLDQRVIDAANADARRAEREAKAAEKAAMSPEALLKRIEELEAQLTKGNKP